MLGFLSLDKPKTMVKRWIEVLRNPTSFYLVLLIMVQIGIIAAASLFVPLFLRYAILPSSIQQEIPLNLVFLPCEDNLHGICSFPTAHIDPIEMEVFSKSTYYQMSVRLHFSDSETNYGIGLFQNELTLLDANGKQLGRWRRTGLLKQPGMFTKALWLMFFPLYILGFFHNYNVLEIPLVGEYYASPEKMAYQLNYALQDRFAQLDAAYLVVNAKFGFIRNFLYYWPLTSFLLLLAATALSGIFIMAFFWGLKGYISYTSRRGSEIVSRKESTATDNSDTATYAASGMDLSSYSSYENLYPDLHDVPTYPVFADVSKDWSYENSITQGLRNRKENRSQY